MKTLEASQLSTQSLGTLAGQIPGATGVFHRYRLDFCCKGEQHLGVVLQEKQLDAETILNELQQLLQRPEAGVNWQGQGASTLINHILKNYHDVHRIQVPELIRLAQRVERVHATHPQCPEGLAEHLMTLLQELESHMLKEEQILFPLLLSQNTWPNGPIQVMRMEHTQHGEALEETRRLTQQGQLPEGACNTWRALYLGLAALERDLMDHIHLENNILFSGLA